MKLKDCPFSPNCVSSQSQSFIHGVRPIEYQSTAVEALQQIKQVMLNMPGCKLVEQEENYLHLEYTTPLCKFVDDVEVCLDDTKHQIHIRSASRVGFWDLETNRRRVSKIRKAFAQQTNA